MYPCTLSGPTLLPSLPAAAAAGPGALRPLPQSVSKDVMKQVAQDQKWPPGWAFDGRKNLFTVDQILDWNMEHNIKVGGAYLCCCSVLWVQQGLGGSSCLGCLQWCPVAGQGSTFCKFTQPQMLCRLPKPTTGAAEVSAAAGSIGRGMASLGHTGQCSSGTYQPTLS